MIKSVVSANVPLHIAFALEKEAEKNNVTVSKMLKSILMERYKDSQNEEDYLAMMAELEMIARRQIEDQEEI